MDEEERVEDFGHAEEEQEGSDEGDSVRLEPVDEVAQSVPHVEAALRLHPGRRNRGHHEREEDVEVLLRGECDGSPQRGVAEIAEASPLQILVQPQEKTCRAEKAPDVVAAEAGVVEEVRR